MASSGDFDRSDGTIVFTARSSGSSIVQDLFRLELKSGRVTRVTQSEDEAIIHIGASCSPDGSRIVHRARKDGLRFVASAIQFMDNVQDPPAFTIDGIAGNVQPAAVTVDGKPARAKRETKVDGVVSPSPFTVSRAPVGTGPFKFVEWKKDDHITVEAFDGYWGNKPKLQRIVFQPVPEASPYSHQRRPVRTKLR